MKKRIYFLPILFLLLSLVLVGCRKDNDDNTVSKTGEASAYGIVNRAYVGKVTVKIKDDKVTDIEFDEAFLPHTWANIEYEMPEGNVIADDVIQYVNADEVSQYYSKYISIDGQLFEGEPRNELLEIDGITYSAQVIKYSNKDIPDLFAYLYNSDKNYTDNYLSDLGRICHKALGTLRFSKTLRDCSQRTLSLHK